MAASNALILCASVLLAAAAASEARDYLVGDADGWKVPAQPDALSKWAQANRFHVGDKLVFKFNAAVDSVLEVTRDDYARCSTASPIATYKAGDATVPLPRSGAHYFVSGAAGSCEKGERLVVVVMSEKHGRRHGAAPAPAPAAVLAPSPLAAGLVGGPGAAPAMAPAAGAAGRTAASAGCGALLLGAILGGLLVAF